jgi:hypothetical protein
MARGVAWRVVAEALELQAAVERLESSVLLGLFTREEVDVASIRLEIDGAREAYESIAERVYLLSFENPHDVVVGVFGEDRSSLFMLARAYYEAAVAVGAAARLFAYTIDDGRPGRDPILKAQRIEAAPAFLESVRDDVLGLALELVGNGAFVRFDGEHGVHAFHRGHEKHLCLVDTMNGRHENYRPPAGIARKGSIAKQQVRRAYLLREGRIEDAVLNDSVSCAAGGMIAGIAAAIGLCFSRAIAGMLE